MGGHSVLILTLLGVLVLIQARPAQPGSGEFDGATSRIAIANQAALNSLLFTIGCWARHEGLGEGAAGRIMNHETAWNLRASDEATDRIRFTAAGWSTTDGVWNVLLPATNTWYHIAVSYDGNSISNEAAMYLNGVSQPVTNVVEPAGTYSSGTGSLYLGDAGTAIRSWDGQLAECFYHNRLLTANEVKSVALQGPKAIPNGLVGYWPLGALGDRNYTSTLGLHGTSTAVILSAVPGPPIAYAPGGETP